ncbi:MAG: metallophosphoesterase family protein [Roseiarcus sp.]|jgi:serine/threonine protein phosphatase 1
MSGERVYPASPGGLTLYAIGDIHGRLDCLTKAQALIDRDIARRGDRDKSIEIYLGDYVDRGPDSKGVIDTLLARAAIVRTVFLRGNHEAIMESFLRGKASFEEWRSVGGLETILSYGVEARALLARAGTIRPGDLLEKLPAAHRRFLSALENLRVFGGYCFVHAGIRPGIPLARQSIEDLTWIRGDFLNFAGDFGVIVVHGHTPGAEIDFLPNRVNVDTGAYATNRLSVVRIDADGLAALEQPRP